MTLSEFKAWFRGYTEHIGEAGAPTKEQWARIKAELDKTAMFEPQSVASIPSVFAGLAFASNDPSDPNVLRRGAYSIARGLT